LEKPKARHEQYQSLSDQPPAAKGKHELAAVVEKDVRKAVTPVNLPVLSAATITYCFQQREVIRVMCCAVDHQRHNATPEIRVVAKGGSMSEALRSWTRYQAPKSVVAERHGSASPAKGSANLIRMEQTPGEGTLMPSVIVKPSITVACDETKVAEYVAHMCGELAELAGKAKLEVLQHLLNMATLEARDPAAKFASADRALSRLPNPKRETIEPPSPHGIAALPLM
jgi:hypothetical protein